MEESLRMQHRQHDSKSDQNRSLYAQSQREIDPARWQGGAGKIVGRSIAGFALLSAILKLIMPFMHREAYLT